MRKILIQTLVIVNCVMLVACSNATKRHQWQHSIQTIEANAGQWLQNNDVPSVSIALIYQGELKWSEAFGAQDVNQPATKNTLYNIASLTKPITTELFLKLAQTNEFQLDEPLWMYWVDPEISSDERHQWLTPRLCLSHQTGFQNWRHEKPDGRLKMSWDPGTQFGYSGEGYRYVAKAAENKLTTPFDQLANEHLFKPLGLNHMSYIYRDEFAKNLAKPFGPQGVFGDLPQHSQWNAAGDVLSTAADYAKFVLSVMQNKGLDQRIWARRYVIDHPGEENTCDPNYQACAVEQKSGYALGWGVLKYKHETIIMHRGGDWGVRSLAYFIPETGFGLVVFTNGSNGEAVIRDVVSAFHNNDHWLDILHK